MSRRSRARTHRRRLRSSHWATREGVLFFCFFAVALLVVSRLGELVFVRGGTLRGFASSQQEFFKVIHPPRGSILVKTKDGDLLPLATDRPSYLLAASPKEVPDPVELAQTLVPILGISQDTLAAKLAKTDDLFEVLKDDLSKDEVAALSSLGRKGISILPTRKRVYPQGALGAHLVGFVGESEQGTRGQYGLERSYEEQLRGQVGFLSGIKNARGYIVSAADGSRPEEKGEDLLLTVDLSIQHRLEQVLSRGLERFEAERAMGLVIEPKSGRILAAANLPSFDPNRYREVRNLTRFLNPLVNLQFEPGSVIKPITFAAALDLGVVTASTTYEDKGRVEIGGWVIENADPKPLGTITLRTVLEKSVNTGAIFVAGEVGMEKFHEYLARFGFGAKTGVDLPAEIPGDIKNLSSNRPVNLATASFGQGIALTPLQIAAAFSAIANNGVLMRPFLVEQILRDGRVLKERSSEIVRQAIEPETARELTELLISVVDNGFGRTARIPGYSIAGKTGTAQIPNPSGGYTNETIHTFAGFGPAPDPRFVIFIRLDKPQGTNFSSSTAAPMFREVAEFLLRYHQIPPDRPIPQPSQKVDSRE